MAVKAWRQESALENLNGDWMRQFFHPPNRSVTFFGEALGGGSFSFRPTKVQLSIIVGSEFACSMMRQACSNR